MTDRQSHTPAGSNLPLYSIADISHKVKAAIEGEFGHIRVQGEVSSVSAPRSGHIYLTFKQDRHELAAVIWKGRAQFLKVKPESGTEYIATGKLTAYSGRSNYQLIVERLEPTGEGELLARLEKLKKQLQEEGLFDPGHRQPIPHLPAVIGVISSQGGAVIHDIMEVLRNRFPRRLLLWPVSVQGPNCAAEVTNAIRGFNSLAADGPVPRPDVLIVARGGGSVEELAGFSEEAVVRAAFASNIPLISAVGHETDTPLIDMVADLRAPTPSVAAEKAVPSRAELTAKTMDLGGRLTACLHRKTEQTRQRLRDLARGLPRRDALFAIPAQRIDFAAQALFSAFNTRLQASETRLARVSARLRQPEIVVRSGGRLAAVSARLRPRMLEALVQSGSAGLLAAENGLTQSMSGLVGGGKNRLAELDRLLESLSHAQVLKRGYAVVEAAGGILVSADQARRQTELAIRFHDGKVEVRTVGRQP